MPLLFLNEFINFNTYRTSSKMYVDVNLGADILKVNIDIEIVHIPCDLLAILTADALCEKLKDVDYNKVKTEMINDEGCKLKGFFNVDEVPGTFQITSECYGAIIQRLANERVLKFNSRHKIKQIRFWEFNRKEIWSIYGRNIAKLSYQLNNIKKNGKNAKIHQYYLKIVPTKFLTYSSKEIIITNILITISQKIQYMKCQLYILDMIFHPITVEYKQYKETFLNFFINI